MNWINVEDKLPKVNGMYIVYAPDGNSPHGEGMWYENIVTLAEYAFGSWWWRENSDDFECIWEQELTRTLDVNKKNNFKITEKLFKWKG